MPTPSSVAEPRRLRYIDSLRGLAALLVVWLHVAQAYAGLGGDRPIGGQWLYRIAQDLDVGLVGVVVFFLLSGFVVPSSLRPERPAPIADFLVRRVFRIFPTYWLSVPLGAWATHWLWGRSFGAGTFVVNLALLQDPLGFASAQGVYWTLSVEWIFYFLCIALYLGGFLHRPVRLGLLAGVLLFVHTAAGFANWWGIALDSFLRFVPLYLSLMLCGTLWRSWINGERSSGVRWLLAGLLLHLLVVLPAATIPLLGMTGNYAVEVALGVSIFIAGTTRLRIENRIGDALGAISYPLYLLHLVVCMPILWWLQQQPVGSWWRTQNLGVYLLVCIVLACALAALVHRFVELPGIEVGRRVSSMWVRWRSRATLPTPAMQASPSDDAVHRAPVGG